MLFPEETERIQQKLDLNEQLLWTGKPIPRAFNKQSISLMLFGIPWNAISWTICIAFMNQVVFGDPNEPVTVNGVKTTVGAVSIWFKIGITVFFIPFITIGIGTLLAPLWKRLSMAGQIYAVTTKRALILGRFRTKSWRAPEIEFIDRRDRRNHTGDIHFAYASVCQNGHHPLVGFDNLSAEALTPAETALRQICKNLD
ncbi:MAG: hypothetical protein IJV69_04250 [Kiritimatiellae bacterium]|nr:hypothetical protein [Kiritimatiellia bacterium]